MRDAARVKAAGAKGAGQALVAGPIPEPPTAGVAEYKAVLQRVLESRPSGTRQRIAAALSKNRSFVTQITSPAYDTPIPARHINLILDICHFSPAERDAFLAAYEHAHPARHAPAPEAARLRAHTIYLPDLGTPERNRRMDGLVADFVQGLTGLVAESRKQAVVKDGGDL